MSPEREVAGLGLATEPTFRPEVHNLDGVGQVVTTYCVHRLEGDRLGVGQCDAAPLELFASRPDAAPESPTGLPSVRSSRLE